MIPEVWMFGWLKPATLPEGLTSSEHLIYTLTVQLSCPSSPSWIFWYCVSISCINIQFQSYLLCSRWLVHVRFSWGSECFDTATLNKSDLSLYQPAAFRSSVLKHLTRKQLDHNVFACSAVDDEGLYGGITWFSSFNGNNLTENKQIKKQVRVIAHSCVIDPTLKA